MRATRYVVWRKRKETGSTMGSTREKTRDIHAAFFLGSHGSHIKGLLVRRQDKRLGTGTTGDGRTTSGSTRAPTG